MRDLLSKAWWVLLLRGILAILFGVLAWSWPGLTLATLVTLFALYALIGGAFEIIVALSGRRDNEDWWMWLLQGLAGVLIGAITLRNPGLAATVLVLYIAMWALSTGVLQIIAAIKLRHEIKGEFWMILGGFVSVLLAFALIASPGAGALAVIWMIAIQAIIFGVSLVILSFKLKGFVKKLNG